MKDKKKKYTCHTCQFPIYESEEVYKSRTITITSRTGTEYSYYKYGGIKKIEFNVNDVWMNIIKN